MDKLDKELLPKHDGWSGGTIGKFTPSPGRLVKVVNEKGEVVKQYHLNRKDRRRLGIKRRK